MESIISWIERVETVKYIRGREREWPLKRPNKNEWQELEKKEGWTIGSSRWRLVFSSLVSESINHKNKNGSRWVLLYNVNSIQREEVRYRLERKRGIWGKRHREKEAKILAAASQWHIEVQLEFPVEVSRGELCFWGFPFDSFRLSDPKKVNFPEAAKMLEN